MGHDHHFLSRLDRVSHEQTELALGLYRDHELVEYLVQRAGVAPHQRFAVAIGPSDVGPYLILQGNGHFVTCLAAGMSADKHRIFPRRWLDETTHSYGVLRKRLARIQASNREDRQAGLVGEILRLGMTFPREDFFAARALAPILGRALVHAHATTMLDCAEGQVLLAKKHASGRALDTLIEHTWRAYWSSSSIALLVGYAGDSASALHEDIEGANHSLTRRLTASGIFGLTVRGIHAAACSGTRAIASHAYRLESAETPTAARDAVLSMLGVGARSPEAWPEIVESFRGLEQGSEDPVEDYAAGLVAPFVGKKHPETVLAEAEASFLQRARAAPVARGNRSAEAHVTDERARLSGAFLLDDDTTAKGYSLLLGAIRYFATCDASDLFLPESVALHAPKLSLREKQVALRRHIALDRAQPGEIAGRNDLCACGSGRKTKRCCVDAGAAPRIRARR